ncbi:RES family NAD+ phosphorylase [Phyllobacterium endophyticum]|uniref:RES family NAD+ phosphorylase n=1 Tax=Phyllobacterium endophyticum TaxID=1149773 RepID=UPI001FEF4FF4|nr:RES family NAD+ phosphorylase [Phyllobacterium endophyticum]
MIRLWRLSGKQHAETFDGGYGLLFDGRWNSIGHAVTYCATSPALCVLEKLVHIEDPALLPELIMVTYEVSDDLPVEKVAAETLPLDWRRQEGLTQRMGDEWHRAKTSPLLMVPSAIVAIAGSPDLNVLINHSHQLAAKIKVLALEPFTLDARRL